MPIPSLLRSSFSIGVHAAVTTMTGNFQTGTTITPRDSRRTIEFVEFHFRSHICRALQALELVLFNSAGEIIAARLIGPGLSMAEPDAACDNPGANNRSIPHSRASTRRFAGSDRRTGSRSSEAGIARGYPQPPQLKPGPDFPDAHRSHFLASLWSRTRRRRLSIRWESSELGFAAPNVVGLSARKHHADPHSENSRSVRS